MGQRNVERHLCGELKEGYLSWRSVQEALISASTERKEKEGNGKRETDTNQQIARSSQRKRRSPANWAKRQGGGAAAARRSFVEIGWLACTTRGRENMRLSECGTRSRKEPRRGRWEIAARGGCS